MFIGKYYFKLEGKGRISLPKEFRQTATDWIVTRGMDGCLFIIPEDQFVTDYQKIINRTFTKKDHRDLGRLLANEAKSVSADNNGRVSIPGHLIEFAKLTGELVIVGSFNRIEVWDRERYHSYLDNLEPQMEEISERIEIDE